MSDDSQDMLEGFVSVRAALLSGNRDVATVYIRDDRQDKALRWLAAEAGRRGAAVAYVSAGEIDSLTSGRSHGGVAARIGERKTVPLADMLHGETPFVAMIDGVEDPFNFGQAVRSLYAAGVDGLVLRPRNWMNAAGVVARASAGASEWVPLAMAATVDEAADLCRGAGLAVAVADKDDAQPIFEADLRQPLLLVIGGEKRGVTRSFRKQADLRLEIPYGREYAQSLGTAAATAIIAFEVLRQRRAG